MKNNDQTSYLFGLPIFSKDKKTLLNELSAHLSRSRTTAYIFTPNPEQIVQAHDDSSFLSVLKQADFLLPDGVGLVIASRILAWRQPVKPLPERIGGREVVEDLITMAREQNASVVVIGGRDYDQSDHPDWEWLPGYADVKHPTDDEEALIKRRLQRLKPAIVFVAFGAPYQEKWVVSHREMLETNQVRLLMVVGGAFDTLTGRLSRPPRWVATWGIEWLYRLVQQPWRWRRQLRLITFGWLTLKEFLK
ncbi:MAG TPA: WecB/TagA/CpsF family glycosyltransferase [Vitreimonas sp.]|nr:WecB/TagA/CpsF family glycosyltransferase [Vitreimonas sp.]